MLRFTMTGCAAAVLALTATTSLQAQEVTLRAISAFGTTTTFSREFLAFVDRVNEQGAGLVQIDLLGGPEAMPPFEVGSAVSNGVVDIANVTGAFYGNLLPIADALKLAELSTAEMRENGAYELINSLHEERMNVHYLARTGLGTPFHIYLTQPIDGPSLEGMRIRTTSVYRAFINATGGVPVQTAPGEVFTALERGQIEGYGWPAQGILDLGWHEHTAYRVDPGFYNVEVAFLVNLDSWNRLNDEQRAFLNETALWAEGLNDNNPELNEAEYARQAEAGVETITLSPEDAEAWLTTAYDSAWDEAATVDADLASQLRALIGTR
ncbi:MAG: TRAP transporter substrate-binding protein DctP [Pararhodobacter sp.]